ncbi:hypothetical protein [Pseudoalteromonas spongiae]|uniref:hypothetical protein n=1 Tax=Pseudoalteromonas spongiae TaxID=298657 RepID=UPI00110BB470|nr:hypothetical protein [Pseudoalteromonas spongiae]
MHTSLFKSLHLTSLAAIVLIASGCSGVVSHQYIKTNSNGAITEIKKNYQQFGDEYQVIAEINGPITLSSDALTITSMSKGSFVKIKHFKSDDFLMISEKNGEVTYGDQKGNTPNKNEIEQFMTSVFDNTPLFAVERTKALIEQQGISAALNQMERANNDDTKSAYITAVSANNLDLPAQKRVLAVLAQIKSDYSQRVTAERFLDKQKQLPDQAWLTFLRGLNGMSSDYETRVLLSKLAPQLPNTQTIHQAYFDVSKTIDSDYEKFRLISEIPAQSTHLSIADMFTASADIGSDYEAYRVVNALASEVKTPNDFEAMLTFMQQIDSDYEMKRAFLSLPYQTMDRATTAQSIELASKFIDSDYELSKTLIHICQKSPYKAQLTETVKLALQSIGSDSDRVKVYDVL